MILKGVSVPYEITLLSNFSTAGNAKKAVSVPYEITLLSNGYAVFWCSLWVSVPYEITLLSNYVSSVYMGGNGFSTL